MSSVPVPAASNPMRPVLPSHGIAVVKSVLSGDTVVLVGRSSASGKAPEVVFTFERVTAPRMASKGNSNKDEPEAFPSREFLRSICVGKTVAFETRKQGASAGDRVYGLLFMPNPADDGTKINLAVEAVRNGYATPKVFASDETDDTATTDESDPVRNYERSLQIAFKEAKAAKLGLHSDAPLVRKYQNAGDDFETLTLLEKTKRFCEKGSVLCVIEYVFDGSRFRCMVTDPDMEPTGLRYGSFTLILAGVACPRPGNPRSKPPTESEPFADVSKNFVDMRLLHRELRVTLHGTDKSGVCAVGSIHHERGNIGVELLKKGFCRVSDWTSRLMNPLDLPAFRVAEINAKRTNTGIWFDYKPPQLTGASEIIGTVVEVTSGDTLNILPNGESYDSEAKLKRVSLASVRAPRLGNVHLERSDEPYAVECKERLRALTVGKTVKIHIHYERVIPMGQNTETRQFGTISVGRRNDVGEVLIAEGLATAQRHRDDDEKSPRYDYLVTADATAKAAKKGLHSTNEYSRRAINDMTDPRKAKTHAGSLIRSGTVKGIVEHVINGSRYKIFISSENCHIMFGLENLRSPQGSPPPGAQSRGGTVRPTEPFGDESKRHARLSLMQRNVEITCTSVTLGGVITGQLFVGNGEKRRDFCIEMVTSGLASVDQRRIDYGEAPKLLIDALAQAKRNKLGIWSVEQKEQPKSSTVTKAKEETATVQLSEIRAGNHFFFHVVGDESAKVVDESMKLFTTNNGTKGAPCDVKVGKFVAALYDDGSGKSWYRAKIVERKGDKAKVLFVDHGNLAVVPLATHLRPLDPELSTTRIPTAAKEAVLAFTKVRDISEEDGFEAANMLQTIAWGKDLTARIFCQTDGKLEVALNDPQNEAETINEQLVSKGFASCVKPREIDALKRKMADSKNLKKLAADVASAQDSARSARSGMWRYGDIDDDEEEF
mmetsp:Transcript_7830/g.7396  ORF Transcript_7830/g.7396 Transcript_7830/m.7396 type:complete len:945 (-) Transcript_7830:92-2926(-)|eukprot:CAMPEP_0197837848 /NCGR_PEP_ID=MMETSP1437-20131217/33489_1 /TAXON_ID=49252 ORGANISM="Eucampia antarctica, Strain CCMP1452" /NCGR_SAMPLE_ID=MMETSP1437 /ASSEMBLY_ACC=CAM_ASM_001096 /LENGTH=944 /DNA_ID=CAMNT_0043445227 /DNA_START=100 /DNA_END=2934 /DNA_ORIENTATION=+